MDFYLPDRREWFQDAQINIQKWTKILPQPATRSVPSPMTIGTNEGLDYHKIVDSMEALPPVVTVEEDWGKIQGLEAEKSSIYSGMVMALDNPLTKDFVATNFVLFGPPGTGKSMTWKAAAGFDGWTVFDLSASKIQQTYQGQANK